MRGALSSLLPALAAGALGAMGLGGGGVLLLWLSLLGMDQLTAQGVNLFFILPVGAVGLWLHRKNGLVVLPPPFPWPWEASWAWAWGLPWRDGFPAGCCGSCSAPFSLWWD